MRDVAAWIWTGAARPRTTRGPVEGVGGHVWISKSLKARTAGDEAEDTEVYLRLISIVFVAAQRGKTCSLGALLWGQRMQDEWKRTDSLSPPPSPHPCPLTAAKKRDADRWDDGRHGQAVHNAFRPPALRKV